jgi:hypothetical protein
MKSLFFFSFLLLSIVSNANAEITAQIHAKVFIDPSSGSPVFSNKWWGNGRNIGLVQVVLDTLSVTPEAFVSVAHLNQAKLTSFQPALPADCTVSAGGMLSRTATSTLAITFRGASCEPLVRGLTAPQIKLKFQNVPADNNLVLSSLGLSIDEE